VRGTPAAIARASSGAEAPPAGGAGDADGHDRGGTKAARARPRRMPAKLARALAKSMERRHIRPRRYDQPFTIGRVTRFEIR
jgi:hypothetical protein